MKRTLLSLPFFTFAAALFIPLLMAGCSQSDSGPAVAPEQGEVAKFLAENPELNVNDEAPEDESDSEE